MTVGALTAYASMPELSPELTALSARSDTALAAALPDESQPPTELHRAMRYSVLGGGKRLRPLLVYATGLAFAAPLTQLDAVAAAVEIVHAYSLIHDDLPAMDNDDLRRGRPTDQHRLGRRNRVPEARTEITDGKSQVFPRRAFCDDGKRA